MTDQVKTEPANPIGFFGLHLLPGFNAQIDFQVRHEEAASSCQGSASSGLRLQMVLSTACTSLPHLRPLLLHRYCTSVPK